MNILTTNYCATRVFVYPIAFIAPAGSFAFPCWIRYLSQQPTDEAPMTSTAIRTALHFTFSKS